MTVTVTLAAAKGAVNVSSTLIATALFSSSTSSPSSCLSSRIRETGGAAFNLKTSTLCFPHRFQIPIKNPSLTIKAAAAPAPAPATAPTQSPPSPDQFRVDVLSESLPYIQKFKGKTVVVKYGGAAMKLPELRASVVTDLVLLSCVGLRPVLVHGGGPEINHWLKLLNIQPVFQGGFRVTDPQTMEIVSMVLVGQVNKDLVSPINTVGATAIGLSGMDGRLNPNSA
uniref:Acetylglutamate kinaseic-like isoform X1 n=1 Tax=Rhizophora mucronata TaxID=61149 RepID=A0A2P2J0C4_RHIMU